MPAHHVSRKWPLPRCRKVVSAKGLTHNCRWSFRSVVAAEPVRPARQVFGAGGRCSKQCCRTRCPRAPCGRVTAVLLLRWPPVDRSCSPWSASLIARTHRSKQLSAKWKLRCWHLDKHVGVWQSLLTIWGYAQTNRKSYSGCRSDVN